MASDNPKAVEAEPPPSSSKERIVFPTLLVGILGGGAGLVSKHRKVMGLPTSCVTDAANFAKVTACYCDKTMNKARRKMKEDGGEPPRPFHPTSSKALTLDPCLDPQSTCPDFTLDLSEDNYTDSKPPPMNQTEIF
ncbi:hypothetical protein ACFX16_045823 [Malus domestica]